MTLISLAIVGKHNEPLFLKEFRDDVTSTDIPEAELFGLTVQSGMGTDGFSSRAKECSLRQQFILHAALDRFDELVGRDLSWRDPGANGADAMWVGLLCPVEDMRVYGYMTTTKLKLMAVVEDIVTSRPIQAKVMEEELKQLLIAIHELLVEYFLNPFNKIDDNKISSPRFNKGVLDSVSQYNRTV
jgi:trafficking protein particle complex subunit 2